MRLKKLVSDDEIADRLSSHFRQLVRFVAVGALNTAFGYTIFALFVGLRVPPSAALLMATVLGILFNFMTTGRIVFRNRDRRLLGRFVVTYGLIYLINLMLLHIFARAGVSAIPAQGICLLAMVPISFLLQKLFVFRGTPHADH